MTDVLHRALEEALDEMHEENHGPSCGCLAYRATEPMQAIAAVVEAAVIWHEHQPSIPSPAFILDHAVTDMLGEQCSCGEVCDREALRHE